MPLNPKWSREEVILALDLYFENNKKYIAPTSPKILELSRLLNILPIHPVHLRNDKFRNPSGVAMKIGNLMAYDPEQSTGLPSSSRMDKAVWEEFVNRPGELHAVAAAIRAGAFSVAPPQADEDDESFPEGRILERLHKLRERNKKVVTKKLSQVMKATGKLACECCNFDFFAVYGERGRGFAECHHLLPLSKAGEGETRLADLAIVCANCHRMLHRGKSTFDLQQLRALLVAQHVNASAH